MKHEPLKALSGGDLLLRRLAAVGPIAEHEAELVLQIRQRPRPHGAGSQITPDGSGHGEPRLITSGWACRPRILPDGRCQMLSIQLPGDLVGDCGDHRPLAMSPVVALTVVRTIGVKPIFEAIAQRPGLYGGLVAALAGLNRLDEAQLLDHVVRLGRQTALQRVSHCLLELYHRSRTIDFVHGDSFVMPLTQETLGDVLGLSLVHVNRTLSLLKRDGLIRMRNGMVSLLDQARLSLVADFTPPQAAYARYGAQPQAA